MPNTLGYMRSWNQRCKCTGIMGWKSPHVPYTRIQRMLNEMGFHQVLVFQLSIWPLLSGDLSGEAICLMSAGWFQLDPLGLQCATCSICSFMHSKSLSLVSCALKVRKECHQDKLTKWYICWIASKSKFVDKRLFVIFLAVIIKEANQINSCL